MAEYPTKAKARHAADALRLETRQQAMKLRQEKQPVDTITLAGVIDRYRTERMSQRYSTMTSNESWLRNHITPRWGKTLISDLRPDAVEAWLKGLALTPKSQSHIRSLMFSLLDAAMFWGYTPIGRNPMQLVRLKGSTKRQRRPTVLTVEQFRELVGILAEPFRSMAQIAQWHGLRFSELIALKWEDVDWLGKKLYIRRGLVNQHVNVPKTEASFDEHPLDDLEIPLLQSLHADANGEWIFASPFQAYKMPWSYPCAEKKFVEAGKKIGVQLGSHTFRHTYRTWLNANGADMTVQRKLMRHADIRTTMNTYGDAIPLALREAHGSVVRLIGL